MNYRLELSTEQMRELGYRVIDYLVDHFDALPEKPPVCLASREKMEKALYEGIPNDPADAGEVLDHVMENVMNHCGHNTHPKAYSFVPGPSNFVSTMAETLACGFNTFSGSWMASPAAAEIEIMLVNWLLELFSFPIKKGGGLFTSGGSLANLTALVTARRIKCGEDFASACVYLSDQAHSSNVKALSIIGFKKQQIRIIPTDLEFKISINKLKNAIAIDKLNHLQPLCLIASAGTTNTGTVDPLNQLAGVCKQENIWFHVDAAYGGAAILSPQAKPLLKGIEKADSITVDPHKWFYQPYEIGCLLVRNHRWLTQTFTEKPEYLRDIEGNESEINFFDHGVQLTRSFKALKLYMSIKTFGLNAFRQAVMYSISLTEQLEQNLRSSNKWEIISPATLAVINFRFNPLDKHYAEPQLDKLNQQISKQIIERKEALFTTTILQGKVVLRMCLINPRTTIEQVMETIRLSESIASEDC